MNTTIKLCALLTVSTAALAFGARTGDGDDSAALVKALTKSRHPLREGVAQVAKGPETALSAKFEFDHAGKLSLSVYTAEKGLGVDAEHNVLKEFSGSPEQAAWAPGAEIFEDVEHVARSAQQQTLMALAPSSLLDIVSRAENETKGQVLSITPVLEGRKAVFVVKTVAGDKISEMRYPLLRDEPRDERSEKR
jgi:hypothetical protein